MDTFIKYFFWKVPKLYPLNNSLDTARSFLKKNLSKWICTNVFSFSVYLLKKKGFSVITVFVSCVYQTCSILRWWLHDPSLPGWNFTPSSWDKCHPPITCGNYLLSRQGGTFSTWHLFRFACNFFEFLFAILSVYEIENPYIHFHWFIIFCLTYFSSCS